VRLLSRKRRRRHSRQDELGFRSLAGFAVEMDAATQTVRDDVVDDMKAEPRASLIAARCEKRFERITRYLQCRQERRGRPS
jgi:hypothetical protein